MYANRIIPGDIHSYIRKLRQLETLKRERKHCIVLIQHCYAMVAVLIGEDMLMFALNLYIIRHDEQLGANPFIVSSLIISTILAGVKLYEISTLPGLWKDLEVLNENIQEHNRSTRTDVFSPAYLAKVVADDEEDDPARTRRIQVRAP